MTVVDALEMIALLRGVPRKYVKEEVNNYIEVLGEIMCIFKIVRHWYIPDLYVLTYFFCLDLIGVADKLIIRTTSNERTRLNFAAAVIGAPPIIVVDEFSAYQNFSVKRVMYDILYHLRKRGHAILISASEWDF